MLVLHHLSDHPLFELSATMFRWITFLGLFQTAALWNSRTGLQEQQDTRPWKDIGAPSKKQDQQRDEDAVMEDVFLDKGSYAQDLDEDYMKL